MQKRTAFQLLGDFAIAAFLLLFVFVNVKEFYATADWGYALVALNESIYVALYLLRQRAAATSASPLDWAVAFSATFLGTLLRPAAPFHIFFGDALIGIGTVTTILSVLFLNRSIGIVPAERGIKTGGPYRLVRHPMYASELLSLAGYLLVNVSWTNICIALGTAVLMLIRIRREESFLSRNETYRAYIGRVRWKLLPFVY